MRHSTTRRSFLVGSATAAFCSPWFAAMSAASSTAGGIGLKKIGRLKTRPSKTIESSPLSVGFETLDRKNFDPEQTYSHLAELGVKWARCQTGWSRCEMEKGQFDFRWLDDVVDSLLAIGVQPWLSLSYGNQLYTPAAPTRAAVGWAPIFHADAQAAWLRYTTAITKHFGNRVRHWEIWNEPNYRGFWQPGKPNPADYARLVSLTAPVLREHVPEAFVVGGAFSSMPAGFLAGCLDNGMAEHVDAVSYHPYRPLPEKGYESSVAEFRKLLDASGRTIRLWQGECGCPSRPTDESWPFVRLPWTETLQAKWLARRVLTDLELKIDLTSYFHTVDLLRYNRGHGPSEEHLFMGLLHGDDYRPKPSYRALQSLCSLLDARTVRDVQFDGRIEGTEVEQARAPGFTRGEAPLCAYWIPADLFEPFEQQTVTLTMPASDSHALMAPVLVDPLSQAVFALQGDTADGRVVFHDLPLRDYPLIVSDRSVVGVEA